MKDFEKALLIINRLLKDKEITWRIGGSTNLILWGISIKPRDIDIITIKSGVYEIQKIFKKYQISPVKFSKTEKFSSHYGKFKINNIDVEVIGNFKIKFRGVWKKTYVKPVLSKVYIGNRELIFPLNDLRKHLKSYERLNRGKDIDKIKLIRNFLKNEKDKIRPRRIGAC